ncbi:hypothetical protein [Galbitalea soli]|uniref:Uncharacterized protein n=1 Tax=Galbitalea soli TaxID=1268042 RepID=A0A7C9PPA1_9MICO|nr:hypothetical protein [Galbitalea soli]NEM92212.1 hypothetical protein [Galbitalea soli]NYJ31834.1 hypothetical protein [Galbitalea soli]
MTSSRPDGEYTDNDPLDAQSHAGEPAGEYTDSELPADADLATGETESDE